MGGENGQRRRRLGDGEGSSPRGRGKRNGGHPSMQAWRLIPAWAGKTEGRRPCGGPLRLIPAWAGKTTWPPASTGASWAHPRVGGENTRSACGPTSSRGSSPRGRGKLRVNRDRSVLIRLIPAWAGKTPPRLRGRPRSAAHPRVGGENPMGLSVTDSQRGSSPRGRGKRDFDIARLAGVRLIPAWAGKTTL